MTTIEDHLDAIEARLSNRRVGRLHLPTRAAVTVGTLRFAHPTFGGILL